MFPKYVLPEDKDIENAGYVLKKACHGNSWNAGWWHDLSTGEAKEVKKEDFKQKATALALIHSEVSEALEGLRKDMMDDKLPHRKMEEVELADAVIRIFDYAGGFGLDLGAAIAEKLKYNRNRQDHKIETRKGRYGKKF